MFTRKVGVTAYELPVFHNRNRPLADLPGELMESGLEWLWTSRRDPPDQTYSDPSSPVLRDWQRLLISDATLLLRDIEEENSENYGRAILMLGSKMDRSDWLLARRERLLGELLKSFTAEMSDVIQIAICQLGDHKFEYVFVPHRPTGEVERLMELWSEKQDFRRRPYWTLHLARLEKLVDYLA
jgi:YD repeat-containing protein